MAITWQNIYTTLLLNRAIGVFPMNGETFDKLALGVSLGVAQWAVGNPSNLSTSGQAVGVAGGGAINPLLTKIIVPTGEGLMTAALAGAGLVGPAASSMGSSLAKGVATAFTLYGQYGGPVAGVGNGVDNSKLANANQVSLAAILMATCGPTMGPGPALPMMTLGIATGICQVLKQGTCTGQIIGVPTVPPVPAAGPTTAMVI